MAEKTASYTAGVTAGTYVRPTTTLKEDGIVTAIVDNSRPMCYLQNPQSPIFLGATVVWGTELYDPSNMSNGTNIVVPTAGVYLVSYCIFLDDADVAATIFYIRVNGVDNIPANAAYLPGSSTLMCATCSAMFKLVAGDSISIRQALGGSAVRTVDPNIGSTFNVQRI